MGKKDYYDSDDLNVVVSKIPHRVEDVELNKNPTVDPVTGYEGTNCATVSASCPSGYTGTPPDCVRIIRDVGNHSDLYDAISNGYGDISGNNIVSSGAVVSVAQGTYTGAPFYSSSIVYFLSG
ncbi:hypothetical protein TL16_g04972 [Triparma laevis f. inornata]|uniref:Uncharacterized protein n=2 Tax=Triparma laevis TaxID=1534972 RepID=A0A9W7FHP9_9STRA|nr:hypothetical protein TL16_g04972 [Triparma laevis f. inornata]GMI12285.1 hypothetical protein TrLO_g643 [Triparma laevis f. longispina]